MVEAAEGVLEAITSSWASQAIYVGVELRLFDLLAKQPLTAPQTSSALEADPGKLEQLMSGLVTLGLLNLDGDIFTLSERGELLCENHPSSLRNWTIWWCRYNWEAWSRLIDTVRTGRSAREILAGAGYSLLAEDPEAARVFHRAMAELATLSSQTLVDVVDFSNFEWIIDVGGGDGQLLRMISERFSVNRLTLFELPEALAEARRRSSAIELISGDFFRSVPAGADCYILKSVLHNWTEEKALNILHNLRTAMSPRSKLLIIERVLADMPTESAADRSNARSDLHMAVAHGAGERSLTYFKELMADAALSIDSVVPLRHGLSLIQVNLQESDCHAKPSPVLS